MNGVSDSDRPTRGICCSGGGIRSAAFSLGALQELSRRGKLEGPNRRFPDREGASYLAAVSGGSYIAAAFTLANRFSEPRSLGDVPAFAEGSPEETFLRNRCSYLAAGLGGKLRLVATIFTNFLANVLFFVALLWVPGRLLGWLYAEVYPALGTGGCIDCTPWLPVGSWVRWAGFAVVAAILVVVVRRMFTSAPTWYRRVTSFSVLVLAGATAAIVVLVVLPQLLALARSLTNSDIAVIETGASNPQVATGLALSAALTTALSQIAINLRSARSLQKHLETGITWYSKLGERFQRLAVFIAAALLGPFAILTGLLIIIHGAAQQAPASWPATNTSWQLTHVVAGTVIVAFLYRFADLTAWSLHPFYKQRLASAFAVQRTTSTDGPNARAIDYARPLRLSECTPEAILESAGHQFPELVICAAANVSDGGETPPGSAVASFAFTPHEVGGALIGSMPTRDYEKLVAGHGASARRNGRMTVPAAIAISGAAISPAMGKMTKGSLRFLLALANMRLGVWLPNPRHEADLNETTTLRRAMAPAVPRPWNLLKEIAGHHRLDAPFLYVTDGGHYENLGLVELLQRGCTEIYCFDASGDPVDSFATLGQAIALARTDAGVEIEIDPETLVPKAGEGDDIGYASQQHVIGTFEYRDGRRGRLAYVRAAVTATVPWDVRAYAKKDKVFPSNPTTSQLYTGERFEAYRLLGVHGARAAIDEMESSLAQSRPPSVDGADGPQPGGDETAMRPAVSGNGAAAGGLTSVVAGNGWSNRRATTVIEATLRTLRGYHFTGRKAPAGRRGPSRTRTARQPY